MRTLDEIKARCIEEGECWLWQGAVSGARGRTGTPCISSKAPEKRRTVPVRRVVWELVKGFAMPSHRVASPKCGNRLCVSPNCAVALTRKEALQLASSYGSFNDANKIRKTTMVVRSRSYITEEMVQTIRAAENGKQAHLLTGVSTSYCKAIRRGDGRRDYTSPFSGLMP